MPSPSPTRRGEALSQTPGRITPMPDTPKAGEQQQQPAPQQAEIVLVETHAHAAYSNFARVTSTAEEVIIDFCLNPNPFATGRQEINVSQRLIMNFYTAKRLFS